MPLDQPYTRDQVLRYLSNSVQNFKLTNAPPDVGTVNLPPASVAVEPALTFQEQNQRTNVLGERIPIDLDEGLPLADYLRIAAQRRPEEQLAILKKTYPDKNARILDSGELAVEVLDSTTGKPKDVVINPAGINAHDFIDLFTQTPEIASGIAAAWATRGRGALRTLGQMASSALATSSTTAARDIVSRGLEGLQVESGEIRESFATDTALDLFLQTGALGAAKAFRAVSPFARDLPKDTLEFNAAEAKKFFQGKFGKTYRLTPGEQTGSTMLRKIEAFETPQPGSDIVFGKIYQQGQEVVREIQDIALGKPISTEAAGAQAIESLRQNVVGPLENAVVSARNSLDESGHQKVSDLIDEIAPPRASPITPTQAGRAIREEFDVKLSEARAKVSAAYAEVRALEGGSGKVLPGDSIADAAEEIRKTLPQVEVPTTSTETELMGFPPQRVTREVEGPAKRETLKSGIPSNLESTLADMGKLRGQFLTLDELTTLKNAAYDEIARTEAVPGVKERWFNQVAKAYEKGIDAGIEATGNQSLKDALQAAKQTYKKELLPFDRNNLRDIAKTPFEAGFKTDAALYQRLFSGTDAVDNWNALKGVLGAKSPAFDSVKRGFLDQTIDAFSDPLTGKLDAGRLSTELLNIRNTKPEIAEDVFGPRFRSFLVNLRGLEALQKGAKLDPEELKVLLAQGDADKGRLLKIAQAEERRDKEYANSILADIAKGDQIASRINPTEFVDRLLDSKTPIKDVEKIVNELAQQSPQVRESVASATMLKLLNESQAKIASQTVQALEGKPLNISSADLLEAIGAKGSPRRARVEAILGREAIPAAEGQTATRLEILENLVKLTAPREQRLLTFRGAGGISSGMQVANLLNNTFKYATTYAKRFALASLYNTQNLVGNRLMGPAETAALANVLISSEPFVSRAVSILGPEQAKEVVADLKASIDRHVQEDIASVPGDRKREEIMKFLQGEAAKVQQRAN